MVAAAADWEPPDASTSSLPPGGAGGSPAHLHSGRNFKATAMLYMPACTWRQWSTGINSHMGEENNYPWILFWHWLPRPLFQAESAGPGAREGYYLL